MTQDSFEIIYGKTYSSLFGMYLASIWLKLVNDKIINAMKVENDIISKKIRQSQVQSQTACLHVFKIMIRAFDKTFTEAININDALNS